LIADAVLPGEEVPKMAVMVDGNWHSPYAEDPAPRIDFVDRLNDLPLPNLLQVLDEGIKPIPSRVRLKMIFDRSPTADTLGDGGHT